MRKVGRNSRMVCLMIVAILIVTFSISSFNLRSLVNALFLEGAALLSIGGIISAGLPKLVLLKFSTEESGQSPEPRAMQKKESRKRNTRIGFALMLAGLVLIGLSIMVGELFLR